MRASKPSRATSATWRQPATSVTTTPPPEPEGDGISEGSDLGPRGPAPTETDAWSTQRIAAVSVGSVGGLGLAAFAVTGAIILDRQATVEADCREAAAGLVCGPDGLAAAEEGRALNIVNAVALGLGLAGAASGALLWALDEPVPALTVSPDGAFTSITVAF